MTIKKQRVKKKDIAFSVGNNYSVFFKKLIYFGCAGS